MKARQNTEKGMALVITLMMLAIVTFMAVVFLTMSRRERTMVKTVEEQNISRLMSDSGTAAATANLVGTISKGAESYLGALNDPNVGNTNAQQKVAVDSGLVQRARLHYSLNVSRNFINANGFVTGNTNALNVSYDKLNNGVYTPLAYGSPDYMQAVANLQYSPRVPVIVNAGATNADFRFYLDLNRNGMFDGTGVNTITGPNNEQYDSNGKIVAKNGVGQFFVGDPEWIGVLERPDLPHSESNRFIGRYAYVILPEGKSLDVNFIHNRVSGTDDNLNNPPTASSTNRFSRNQGVGFWELNLAAFLVDFHNTPNTWGFGPNRYEYDISTSPGTANGLAFKDALGVLDYRLNSLSSVNPPTRQNLFHPDQLFVNATHPQFSANIFWANDYIDEQGDGAYIHYQNWHTNGAPIKTKLVVDINNATKPWFGYDRPEKTGEIPDVQKYFGVGTSAGANFSGFYNRFTNAVSSTRTNTYDRYAYYRFISQMGADSVPALQGRIHLNYTNEPGSISTNLFPWVYGTNAPLYAYPTPVSRPTYWETNGAGVFERQNTLTNFFLMAANEMLRRSLVTNVFIDDFNRWRTNYTIGGPYFISTNINVNPNPNVRRDLPRIIANMPVRHDISITNIQVYHEPMTLAPAQLLPFSYVTNNEYSSALHRILQLAANIYDNMTNAGPVEPYFPSVWRPLFTRTQTNILITGFVMDPVASTFPTDWATPEDFYTSSRRGFDGNRLNIFGIPAVIGAKKGWPNFNELSIETSVQIGRKLQLTKDGKGGFLPTNQMFTVGISNTFGIEAWNSYAQELKQHSLELRAQILSDIKLEAGLNGVNTQVFLKTMTLKESPTPYVVPVPSWKGRKGIRPDVPRNVPIATASLNVNSDSDFRIPLYAGTNTLEDSGMLPFAPYFQKALPGREFPAVFLNTRVMPDFFLTTTNRVYYMAIDKTYDRIVDLVNLEKLVRRMNVTQAMGGNDNAMNQMTGTGINPGMFWDTNLVDKANANSATVGQLNQILASLGEITLSDSDWRNYNYQSQDKGRGVDFFRSWMGLPPLSTNRNNNVTPTNSVDMQAPFSPVRKFYLRDTYQAKDPLVHYMLADLYDADVQSNKLVNPPNTLVLNEELGWVNRRYDNSGADFYLRDPRIFSSDDWIFPIAKLDDPTRTSTYGIPNFLYRYPNIGALGQIHRGTPWQTVYLKAGDTALTNWAHWSGSYGTHPVNDWKLLDVFTTAMSENAARGLLSVNQTNLAAWSAVLSGVQVITNSVPDSEFNQLKEAVQPRFGDPKTGRDLVIQPGSTQLSNIVAGINRWRSTRPLGVFGYMGEILGVPELSMGYFNNVRVASPYLNYQLFDKTGKYLGENTNQLGRAFTDEALEAIPARILSLLKPDETRVVIYSFGQALKPAPRSLATSANFYNLCLNYQVTGEYATKTVVRVEGEVRNTNNPVRTVIESFEQLPPFE
jgi:hypothetical protein